MLRPTIAFIVLSLATSTSAAADSPVIMDCGDGSPLAANADTATLLSLQSSVQGMLDNPTGVTCSLTAGASDPTVALVGGASDRPFVVGGGRFDRGPGPGAMQGCGVNFGLSAHLD